MKINLINLPSEETSILPPLDLAYIGALLKGHELKLVDFNFDEEVEDADLNIVGTTSVDYYNNPPLNLDHIFSYLDKIDGKKIIFGPHVTSTPKIFQKYGLLHLLVLGSIFHSKYSIFFRLKIQSQKSLCFVLKIFQCFECHSRNNILFPSLFLYSNKFLRW